MNFLASSTLPVFIAAMDGDSVYKRELPEKSILIMGNEANGISEEIKGQVQNSISIPQYGENAETESLNVATATAILLNEFRRN